MSQQQERRGMADGWGSLHPDLLELVMGHLNRVLSHHPVSVAEAARLAEALSANRHWRREARPQLRLSVRCNLLQREHLHLLRLAASGVTVVRLWCEGPLASVGMALVLACDLQDHLFGTATFRDKVAPHLQLLAGVPAGLPACHLGMLQPCCSTLRSLHLHAPDGFFELKIGGSSWAHLAALRELAVTAGASNTVTVEQLPPAVRQLSVTTECVYADPPVLLSVPSVRLAALEVYLVANTFENNLENTAWIRPLHDLAAMLAVAGMPPGHVIEFCTKGVWYKRPDGDPAWVHAARPAESSPVGEDTQQSELAANSEWEAMLLAQQQRRQQQHSEQQGTGEELQQRQRKRRRRRSSAVPRNVLAILEQQHPALHQGGCSCCRQWHVGSHRAGAGSALDGCQQQKKQQHGLQQPEADCDACGGGCSMVPQVPRSVLLKILATEPAPKLTVTTNVGNVWAHQVAARCCWPLQPGRDDPATPAMRLTLIGA